MSSEMKHVAGWRKPAFIGAFFVALFLCIWLMRQGGPWLFVGAVGAAGSTFGYIWGGMRVFSREPVRPVMRRYMLRFGASMSAYTVLLMGAVSLHDKGLTTGPLGYAIALAPAIAVLCAIASLGLYLAEETDEFLRANLIQSLLWGTGATLGVATVWGFLETFDKAPHVPGWAVVPLFAIAMGVAQILISRRYR
jgi:hypothetical protein